MAAALVAAAAAAGFCVFVVVVVALVVVETVAVADNVEVEVVIQFPSHHRHLSLPSLMHYFQVHTHTETAG